MVDHKSLTIFCSLFLFQIYIMAHFSALRIILLYHFSTSSFYIFFQKIQTVYCKKINFQLPYFPKTPNKVQHPVKSKVGPFLKKKAIPKVHILPYETNPYRTKQTHIVRNNLLPYETNLVSKFCIYQDKNILKNPPKKRPCKSSYDSCLTCRSTVRMLNYINQEYTFVRRPLLSGGHIRYYFSGKLLN